MSSRENHETLATGFVRDLQAGIMPEAVVWGCLRLPMMLVMVVFLGAAGWLLSGYAQGNRKTEAEYLSSPVAIEQDARLPNSRTKYEGVFLRQELGQQIGTTNSGQEVVRVTKYLAYCSNQGGREYFGSFTRAQCARLVPNDKVQFEVFNGVITELDWKGEHFLAVDHPLRMRQETKIKSVFFAALGVCAGLLASKLLLFRS